MIHADDLAVGGGDSQRILLKTRVAKGDPPTAAQINGAVRSYAANPDIVVKQIPFDDDVYSNTGLITQLQGQDVPDIYFQWAGYPVRRDAEAGLKIDQEVLDSLEARLADAAEQQQALEKRMSR